MTRQVRRLSGLMLGLFLALFVNLNVVQVLRADDLADHPANGRLIIQEYRIRRGSIVVGDTPIARSEGTDDEYKYLRVYEPATLYSHLVGYYSIEVQRAGLERTMNDPLTGTRTDILAENLAQLFGERDPAGDTVRLTVEPAVQQAAADAVGPLTGAVVAIDPRTGEVLAHYSNPTYDPNVLSSHDRGSIQEYWRQLNDDPARPLIDRAVFERYQPGSVMKLIVAAAALEHDIGVDTQFEDPVSYTPPGTTRPIHNYSGGTCEDTGTITFGQALIVSCNTVFARLGVQLGADRLVEQAEKFGLNRRPPYELPVSASVIPKELDQPATAQSAIGARDVQVTALQMAMVAGAIVNDGVLMRPRVIVEVLDPSGRRLSATSAAPWVDGPYTAQAVSRETAATLRGLMIRVVEVGTGHNAAIEGAIVGGKTGTADPGEEVTPHAWFVGFAEVPEGGGGSVPRVAVAVVLPNAGEGATGGGTAAPIARAVMAAALASRAP